MNSKYLAVLVACFALVLPGIANAETKIGAPAPDFSLADSNGVKRSLSEFKGKFVVLEWLNPECPFVKKHYKPGNMQKLQADYTAKGVVWLTINSSAPGKQGHLSGEQAAQFVRDQKASPTAILLDPEGTTGKAYGARTTPHMYIIDPNGTLTYAGAIDDNDSSSSDSIAGAKNYVTVALDQALAGKPVTVASSEPYGCSVKYAS